jgi:pyruvate dehydrogenase E2 component (dihydrolipoyllysine-residue acetyltransferase)
MAAAGGSRVERPTKMRAGIARRMSASKHEIPHFYVSTEIRLDEALTRLAARDAAAPRLTLTAVLVRASVLALQEHPRLNAHWTDDGLVLFDEVNLAVAVALAEGLIAPALVGAQLLDLEATSAALEDLVERARVERLRPPELSSGTFTLSNLGMFEVTSFTAIVNPPQVAILAVGRSRHLPRLIGGELRQSSVLSATLSADHRALDGADAARFLETLKRLLEAPEELW